MARIVTHALLLVAATTGHLSATLPWQELNMEQLVANVLESRNAQGSIATWKKYESPYLNEAISSSDLILEGLIEQAEFGATSSSSLTEEGFQLRPGYNEEVARLEVVRTILLGLSYVEVSEFIYSSAFDDATTVADLVNFHALASYSQNRPNEMARHSEWAKLGKSSDALYRLAAIELISRTWPDTVNENESERNEFTFEVALARRIEISNYQDDQNTVVARAARDKLKLLNALIDQLKTDFGLSEGAMHSAAGAIRGSDHPARRATESAAQSSEEDRSSRSTPRPLSTNREEPSPTRWPVVVAVVAALGLLWLLLKKRK